MMKTKQNVMTLLFALLLSSLFCITAMWVSPVAAKADDAETTVYNITELCSTTTDPGATKIYFYGTADKSVTGLTGWTDAFSGKAKVNGTETDVTLKFTNMGDYCDLYMDGFNVPENGILEVGGNYTNTDKNVTFALETTKFLWNGSAWSKYVETTVYNVSGLTSTATDPAATKIYFYGTVDKSVTGLTGWADAFSGKAKVNGTETDVTLKFTNMGDYCDLYMDGFSVPENGTLEVGGEYTNENKKVTFVLESTHFLWNGSAWKNIIVYTEYNVTDITPSATDPAANHMYLWGKIGGTVTPSWDIAYVGKISLNGVETDATIKYWNKGDYDDFYLEGFKAEEGNTLILKGSFTNDATKTALIFEETQLQWTGSEWDVVYTEYNVTDITATATDPGANHIYLVGTLDGTVTPDWGVAYQGKVVLNGTETSATIKYTNHGDQDDFYLEGFTATEDDILILSGMFKNKASKTALVFESVKLTWKGSAWKKIHVITFKNYDDTLLQTVEVAEGVVPVYTGDTPEKPQTVQHVYTFNGWTPELVAVTGAATYVAQFTESARKYTITFVNYDGTELESKDVDYGTVPAYTGETPQKPVDDEYFYVFKGWNPELVEVTGEATYTAQFEQKEKEFLITFKNYDGTTLQNGNVATGTMPAYNGETPVRESTAEYNYTFSGWSPELVAVTGEATYTAQFTETKRTYTVIFKNYDGTILLQIDKEYGLIPEYTGDAPERASTAQIKYTFSGWDKDIVAVTENVTYTAKFTETTREYTVTVKFAGLDLGNQTLTLAYGSKVDFNQFKKSGYSFAVKDSSGKQIDIDLYTVTGNDTLTVEYSVVSANEEEGCFASLGASSMLSIATVLALCTLAVIKRKKV